MTSTVTEIASGVFRISAYVPDYGIQFNQFLIHDAEPFLMHTGFKKLFAVTRDGVGKVLDPSRVRWVGFSHFESDECGALNEWLATAPQAQAVCSYVGAVVSVDDFAMRAARPLADNEILHTGRHRLRFLATPHVPHSWDAGLFFDEAERVLLCSDLFFQPGDPEPLTASDLVGPARAAIIGAQAGPLANDMPYTRHTDPTLQRLADLKPRTLATMHGSSFSGDGEHAMRDLAAVLRETLGGS